MNRLASERIIAKIKTVLPNTDKPIGLHEPSITEDEISYVTDSLKSGWVSTAGPYVEEFERRLAEYTGATYAVAMVNGTSALHITLKLVGVCPGDEVLVPALTFIATANAVSYCEAIPHFVDVDPQTLGIDPIKLEDYLQRIADLNSKGCINRLTGRRISAIIPMHTFGHPVDLDRLLEVSQRFNVPIVEDAAEALGTLYKGTHVGGLGAAGILSFNGNKIITTGGGGAVLTNDPELYELAKHISKTAKIAHRWEFIHDTVGYNYRLPNLNAALGCAQLNKLPYFIDKKRELFGRYFDTFRDIEEASIFSEPKFARSNYWLNTLILNKPSLEMRDYILDRLHQENIIVRPAWQLMHKLPPYRNNPRMGLDVAEDLVKRIINLPSSPSL